MRINFYDAMLTDGGRTTLVKEKAVNYDAGKMNTPESVVMIMRGLLHMEQMAEEHCYMVALNSSCRIIGMFLLSKGTVNAALITPREVYIRALLVGAVQIIVCHNHPSGGVTPSNQDLSVTKQLREVGELININLADHIIIGSDGFLSFKQEGML